MSKQTIETLPGGTIIEEWRNDEGHLDRDDGPAVIETWPDGDRYEEYWKNGKFIEEKEVRGGEG